MRILNIFLGELYKYGIGFDKNEEKELSSGINAALKNHKRMRPSLWDFIIKG